MNAVQANSGAGMILDAASAADLMGPTLVSIEADATVDEAVDLLIAKGYSAAPVIDEAGRAVGVLSRSDLLVHSRGAQRRRGARVLPPRRPVRGRGRDAGSPAGREG